MTSGISSNDISQKFLDIPGMRVLLQHYLSEVPSEETDASNWHKLEVSDDASHGPVSRVFHRHVETDTLYRSDSADWLLLKHIGVATTFYLSTYAYSYKWTLAGLGVAFIGLRQLKWAHTRYQEDRNKENFRIEDFAKRELTVLGKELATGVRSTLKVCGYAVGAFAISLYGFYNPREARVYLNQLEDLFKAKSSGEEKDMQKQSVREVLTGIFQGRVFLSNLFKLDPVEAESEETEKEQGVSLGGGSESRAHAGTPLDSPASDAEKA